MNAKPRVLIVEQPDFDKLAVIERLKKLIEDNGFDVSVVVDGQCNYYCDPPMGLVFDYPDLIEPKRSGKISMKMLKSR